MQLTNFLTVDQAATVIGVDPRQVRHYCAAGQLPAQRIGQRLWVISRAAVERFVRPKRGNPSFLNSKKKRRSHKNATN